MLSSRFIKIILFLAAVVSAAAFFLVYQQSGKILIETITDSPVPKAITPDKLESNSPLNGLTHAASTIPVVDEGLSEQVREKLGLLREILKSRNDNDPRLDTELTVLSREVVAEFKKEYSRLPKEKLNDRGTIIFLVGRNILSVDDLSFLAQVAQEPSCLSLSNCFEPTKESSDADHLHHESATDVTLAYPQIVAIQSVENYLKNSSGQNTKTAGLTSQAREVIEQARKSPIKTVRSMAERIHF